MKRISELDLFRGLMLVVMTLNHLPGNGLYSFEEFFGFVSSAEGFVFVSGVLVGRIFSMRLKTQGFHAVRHWFFRRMWQLYFAHVLTIVCILLVARSSKIFSSAWHEFGAAGSTHFLQRTISALLLLYQPRYLDVLPMFCGFLALAPYVLRALEKNQTMLVFGLSISVWILSRYVAIDALAQRSLVEPLGLVQFDQSPFRFLAWQFLFIAAISLGRRSAVRPIASPQLAALLFCGVFIAVCFCWRHGILPLPGVLDVSLTQKPYLGLLRIAEVASFATLIFALVRFRPEILKFRWLELLGRHSMSVYVFHVVLLYVLAPWRTVWARDWSSPTQFCATTVCILSLTLPALAHQRWRMRFGRGRVCCAVG